MKRYLALAFVLLLALLAAACGAAAVPTSAPESRSAIPAQPPSQYGGGAVQPDIQGKAVPVAPADTAVPGDASATDRMIIKTAELSLTVKDAAASLETVKSTVAALGGFVSNSQTTRVNKDQVRVNVTVRVPADKFDDALAQIKQATIRVNSEHIGGQDVTEQYTDLNPQLNNLEATEKELLALMTTVREKTSSAQDILAVQREINNVRMQIDQLTGRIQYLERSTAMATITLDLVPDSLEAPVASDVWEPAGVARDALRSLVTALQGVATVGIYVVVFVLPVVLVVALPLVAIVWLLRRQRRKPAVAS